mmetsp:Transcript_10712/g.19066  ORF Transcript_10712/g.19066 Transcript_10712/m.19066 type:complete len:115 (+) Transcript_10712:196-540(+)
MLYGWRRSWAPTLPPDNIPAHNRGGQADGKWDVWDAVNHPAFMANHFPGMGTLAHPSIKPLGHGLKLPNRAKTGKTNKSLQRVNTSDVSLTLLMVSGALGHLLFKHEQLAGSKR